ncbi:unnamed protein product [Cuscuta epithymum]|uniref:Uncharacterized protein n=1 Tax=Cuscuta epithymum TaxID=186058 RepID=A0AAV0FSL5_9ASTE|nr:unnamed protein product [Cuscuta epithymum]
MGALQFKLFSALCSICLIANAELINYLPGQPKKVTFKQYSGYIVTDEEYGRSLFYYFAEAQSKHALTLPLTIWLGGASNMLYVDSPIGTGFSFSDTSSDYTNWNQTMTVNENMKFLLKWFEKFPQYKISDLYLAGDGSGGFLVPQFGALVLEYNKKTDTPVNLKGLALGNLGLGTPGLAHDDYLWYHGAISEELYIMLKTVCSSVKQINESQHGNMSRDCQKVSDMLDEEIGEDFNMESFLMPKCVSSNSIASEDIIGDPCLSQNTLDYLNQPEVTKALHVNKKRSPKHWDICEGQLECRKSAYLIKNFGALARLLERHIRLLLYSGDQDVLNPVVETRKFAQMLAKELQLITLQKNRPWYDGSQVAGWSEGFGKLKEGINVTYLTFASMRGGSHFAPSTSPSKALKLFKAFLEGSSPAIII